MIKELSVPNSLASAVRERHVVPFVGSGLSLGVKLGLFPTWEALLEKMAGALANDAKQDDCTLVRIHLKRRQYFEAAQAAFSGLGKSRFNSVLIEQFPTTMPRDGVDLSVLESLWRLECRLVITTNYDSVLSWANLRARAIVNRQHSELAMLMSSPTSEAPWVWHIHGHIEQLDTIILTPEQYRELYSDRRETLEAYRAAKLQLRNVIANTSLLFLGFGLSDRYVMNLVSGILSELDFAAHPHFAVVKAGEADARKLWDHFNIQCIEISDWGRPMRDLLDSLSVQLRTDSSSRRHQSDSDPPCDPLASDDSVAAGPNPLAFSPWAIDPQTAIERLGELIRENDSAMARWKLACAYARRNQLVDAREELRHGDRLASGPIPPERILYEGLILFRGEQLAEAEAKLREFFKCKGTDPLGIAVGLDMLGTLASKQGRLSEANDFYASALREKEAISDVPGQCMTLGNLGRLALYSGNDHGAVAFFKKNLSLTESISDAVHLGLIKNQIAEALLASGDIDQGAGVCERRERQP